MDRSNEFKYQPPAHAIYVSVRQAYGGPSQDLEVHGPRRILQTAFINRVLEKTGQDIRMAERLISEHFAKAGVDVGSHPEIEKRLRQWAVAKPEEARMAFNRVLGALEKEKPYPDFAGFRTHMERFRQLSHEERILARHAEALGEGRGLEELQSNLEQLLDADAGLPENRQARKKTFDRAQRELARTEKISARSPGQEQSIKEELRRLSLADLPGGEARKPDGRFFTAHDGSNFTFRMHLGTITAEKEPRVQALQMAIVDGLRKNGFSVRAGRS